MSEMTTREALTHLVDAGRIEKVMMDWMPGGSRRLTMKLLIEPADAHALNQAIDDLESREAEAALLRREDDKVSMLSARKSMGKPGF